MQEARVRSVVLVTICSGAQLVVQLWFQITLARSFGASEAMDCYVSALGLPTLVSAVIAGSVGYCLVPVLIDRRTNAGEHAAHTLAASSLVLLLLLTGTLFLGTFLFATPLIGALHPGFSDNQIELAAGLLRLLGWLVVTNSLIAHLQALYHAQERFAVPAFATLVGTGFTLVWLAAFNARSGINAAAWAVLLGSVIAVVLQLPITLDLREARIRVDQGLRRVVALAGPLVFGSIFLLEPLADRYLASRLPAGEISHLSYSSRIVLAILQLCAVGMSTVAFPMVARSAAERNIARLHEELRFALRFLTFVLVPICIGLAFFGEWVIRDLFERGAFQTSDTRHVARLVLLYLGWIIGGSVGGLFSKTFYALQDTRTPTAVFVLSFAVAIAVKFGLFVLFGIDGIAISTSTFYLLNTLLQYLLLHRRLGPFLDRSLSRSVWSSVASSFGASAVVAAIAQWSFAGNSIVGAMVGAGVYLSISWWFNDDSARRLIRLVRGPTETPRG